MISKFSVKKPFTVVVAMILVVILGVISFTSMSTDLLPKMDLPYVIVMTTYPGASPEKIESSVTKPLEETLATASGIKKINSTSNENSSTIMLEFEQDINMDSVMLDLSSKIELVKNKLDEKVSSPMIMKLNPNMMPIMTSSVDIDGLNSKETSKFVKEEVIPSFERINGVASVEATGLLEESIRITLDSKKIDNLNNKVLKSIDSKLADAKKELDKNKAKIQEGKALLDKQSLSKTEELVNGSIGLNQGKTQIEDAIKNLPQLKKDLEGKKSDLQAKRDGLLWAIKEQEKNNIPVTAEQKGALEQLESGIKSIDDALKSMDSQKSVLEKKLEELLDNQKKLELGKVTLNNELSKVRINLMNGEAELNKATKEFEKSRDEAYKKANLEGVITKDGISKILMAQNFSMPAGYIKEGDSKYIVKVGDTFNSMKQLNDLVLFHMDVADLGDIHIDDIGEIKLVDNAEDTYVKINKNNGIILSFQKQSTFSTTEVSKSINENIKKLMKDNKKLHINTLNDQGVYIDIVINSVLDNLVLGGVLAVIILFIFLKSIKPTIVIAFSIPISLLFAIAMMYFSGVTMNIISLAGLALGVGMLVDNSIVVIENIQRLRDQGMSAAKAAVKGTTQVAGAITASTLTTISVFLPIVFTKGMSRQLFTDMGLTIAYSLIASLIIAVTLVPTMASITLRNIKEKEHKLFDKFVAIYEKSLKFSLNHRAIFLIGALVLLIGSVVLSVSKGTILLPNMDSNQMSVSMKMPKGSDRKSTRELSEKVVDIISSIKDVQTIGVMEPSSNGGMNLGGGSDNRTMSFYILLKDDKKLSSQQVGDLISDKTKNLDCKIKVTASNMDMSAIGDQGISINIKGPDLEKLKSISKDISSMVEKTKGTYEISNGLDDGSKETRIIVDKSKAMKKGLTVAQIYQDISEAIKTETTSTTLNAGVNEYPIILVNKEEDSLSRADLKKHKITVNKDGKEEKVNLTDVAKIEETDSLNAINRDEQVRTMSVKALVKSDYNVGNISTEIDKKIKAYKVPDGYSIKMGGEKESMDEAFGDLIKMIALAIVFIYLIMVAQFQSLLSPFIVLFTIPLAFTGGFLGLVVTNFELSMIAMLGFLILSGIVVNNGIVFVDYVNQLRLEGMDKKEALIVTGRTRIRPILMTALTTILGLSTLALGIGMGSDMIQPMAIVTIGGLTYATILTLFIVPIIYDILNRKELKQVIIEDDID